MSAGSPETPGADSLSEHFAADNYIHQEAEWSAGTSPPRPERHKSISVSPDQDPDSEEPELSAARHNNTDEAGIDFRFGVQAGDPWPKTRTPLDVAFMRVPGRPKAAAKLLVRSGLRCHRCLLKAWVCLCNRAPVELDRRGTAPSPSERYWLFCLPCKHLVVPFRPFTDGRWHAAHSGSARVRHHRWRAAIPVRSAITSPTPLYPRTEPPDIPYCRSIIRQFFMHYSYCEYPPNPMRTQLQPNRGPKSAPEPCFERQASLTTNRLRGVRVSPLSAGGEGLCKAQSGLLKRPGKLAEGIQQQLGLFSCHYYEGSGHHHLYTLSRSVPWGSRLRLWKFKYRVVRFKKKRSRKMQAGTASGSHTQSAGVIRGRSSAVDTWAQGCHPSCRAGSANSGRPRRFQLLVLLLSCTPTRGTGTAQEPPGMGRSLTQASRGGKRAWIKAQRQACQQGHAWYRGRVVWSTDIPHHAAIAQPSRRPRRIRPGATPRGATARLKIMTLNVGHMSAFLWSELKAYLGSSTCDYDVVCLQELHWSQTCQFSVGGWSAVVSAGPDRSDGVMVLVSPKFRHSQVKYDEIVRGRLLRVQIAVDDARVEVFCCYQFVWQTELTKEYNLRRRQVVLDKLCTQVRAIARRSTVVVLGDFNAELVPSPEELDKVWPTLRDM